MPKLAKNTIYLHQIDLERITASDLTADYALLSAEEKKRADRYSVHHAYKAYVATHSQLRRLLGKYLDCSPEAINYRQNEYGKLYLSSFWYAQQAIQFNISHTRNHSVIAFALNHEVGIDIEQHDRKLDALSLAKRYFASAEYEQLVALPVAEQSAFFYQYWTLKEAVVKTIGCGLVACPLDAFVVDPFNANNALVSINKTVQQRLGLSTESLNIQLVSGNSDYTIAVGQQNNAFQLDIS